MIVDSKTLLELLRLISKMKDESKVPFKDYCQLMQDSEDTSKPLA